MSYTINAIISIIIYFSISLDTCALTVKEDQVFYKDEKCYLKSSREPFTGETTSYHPNGKIWIHKTFSDGQASGVWTTWSESGRLISMDSFNNNSCIVTAWFESGRVKYQVFYSKGIIEERIFFAENGQRTERTVYNNEGKRAVVFYWHENGQKMFECKYDDKGNKDGFLTEWYKNGQLKRKAYYKNGMLNGMYSSWSPNGDNFAEGTYKNDKQWEGTFFDNGKVDTYEDGKLITSKYCKQQPKNVNKTFEIKNKRK